MILYVFISANFLVYFSLLIWYLVGILKLKKTKDKYSYSYFPEVSIIVCVRDGENSLPNILGDLELQKYSGKYEVIIVDDGSTDLTKNLIKELEHKNSRFKYVSSEIGSSNLDHKKKALDAGIKTSNYKTLLFTDVDCRLGHNWISSMMQNYNLNADYIVGYSKIDNNNSLVAYFQSIDLKMMMYCSMGAISMSTPHGCIGQNQSYKKSVFINNGGFNKISKLLQGDDSIFLQLCNNNSQIKTVFSLDKNSYVTAKTHIKWLDLIKQRARWAGDAQIMWKYNIIWYFGFIGFFISNLISLFVVIFYYYKYYLVCYLVIIKLIIELLIFYFGNYKIQEKTNLLNFLIWFFIHIPYVVLMGILSPLISKLEWKGRINK